MRLAALFLVMAVCGTSIAAPAPFLESSVPDAMLETGSKARTDALLRWLKASDLAQAVHGQPVLPASFAGKLKAIPKDGFRVVLRLQGGARTEDRALFKKLVARVSRAEAKRDVGIAGSGRIAAEQQLLVRKLALIRGGGRGGLVRGGGLAGSEVLALEQYVQHAQDSDIRANPPRLVKGPSRR
jgi:hypothetical protein